MDKDLIKNFNIATALVDSQYQVRATNDSLDTWIGETPVGAEFSSLIASLLGEESQIIFSTFFDPKSEAVLTISVDGTAVELSSVSLSCGGYLVFFKDVGSESEKLQSSYKPFIEKSPIATAIYRPDGTIKYYNKAFGIIWSKSGEQLPAPLNDYNIFDDEQLKMLGLMPFIQKGFDGEITEIPPVRYNPSKTARLTHYGIDQEKYIKGHIYPIKYESGNIWEVALVISDVTFQMQAEEILTENHLKFQLLTMGVPGVIYEYDFDDEPHFNFLSQGAIEMFGYTPEEIIDDPSLINSIIHEDDVENFLTSSHEAAKNAQQWEWQGRFRVDGQVKWIEAKSDTGGSDPNKRFGLLLDVTERVLAEKRSKRNELLFGQLFDNSPLGLVLLDEKHNVVQINHGFKEIFGFDSHELTGKKLNDLIVPKDGKLEAISLNTITARGEVVRLESVRIHKNQHKIPVIIYGVPVSLEDRTIGIYGIYVDITDRTRIENELKIRNDELDNFVYKVSHDLRAPLSSVLGLVNLAKLESSTENLKEYIEMIGNRIKLLDGFINDVLSHSKNLKLELELGTVHLEEVIRQCFSDLSYLPFAGKVEVELNVQGEAFYSDQWRVNEIFRNLISNAIKYVDPDKKNSFIKLDVNVTHRQALIKIKDNGIGIAKDTLPRIFDMFYRATEYSEGSGIGLYIVKKAIQKLGGAINIRSKEGLETTFEIQLPNQNPNNKSL